MGLVNFMEDLWRFYGRAKPGRPGQIEGNAVFCPVAKQWIGSTFEMEASASRTNYDDLEGPSLRLLEQAQDFNSLMKIGKWDLLNQLSEAVTMCQFCEVHCLGNEEGPSSIPPYDQIDRKKLHDLVYGNG